ncbi:hypothetical protein Acr_01g0012910 [Actinidia rufa]|uniref:Retrovirus-related Pol polyprotein from transposon TNT 1-94-like beta-barrel domain-containing protein n=1 Tax=Actinidia rufa TaxID=165716 RepID=A0A7J0E5E1_9ERIC|nr:hypothetical protein Acr_01g0012910 [Actinidia rufa]
MDQVGGDVLGKDISEQSLIDKEACEFEVSERDYSGRTHDSLPESWETLVVCLSNSVPNGKLSTHMVMDALFNEEARKREMSMTDQKGHIKRDCPKYKAQDQFSNTAAIAVKVVDEDEIDVLLAESKDGKSNWVLDSGSAYHLCRDREVFSTYAPCEGRVWMANNTASRVIGRGSVRFRMADERSVTLTEDVHREAHRKETKLILRSYTAKGAATPKRVSFALDLISGGDLSNCVHKGGEIEPRQLAKSYGGAGSEAVRMDNLKISDYTPVGWRGRLLSLAHLDESKPTWR